MKIRRHLFAAVLGSALLLGPGGARAAGHPAELGVLEHEDGDTSLSRLLVSKGVAEAVQTENEEAAWWWDFSQSGGIFYAEGNRLRRDSEGDQTPVLVANLERSARVPAALGVDGRVAFASVNDVSVARWDDAAKKLIDIHPVLLPLHCRGRDLAFSKDGRTLFVLCRTPAPVNTWFVAADTTTGRGEHLFAKDADRLLGTLKDGGPMVLVVRAGNVESAVTLGPKGKPSVLFKAKDGETLAGILSARGELVIAAPPPTSGKNRAIRVAKPGEKSSRVLVKGLAYSELSVSPENGLIAVTLPAPGEVGMGDVALLKAGDASVRKVLRGDAGKKHYYSSPKLRE